jgi:Icc-related predicted phosphoesterase
MGNLYIIGDVHGELRAFKEVLNHLHPIDTLVIAGDLIDRGRDK